MSPLRPTSTIRALAAVLAFCLAAAACGGDSSESTADSSEPRAEETAEDSADTSDERDDDRSESVEAVEEESADDDVSEDAGAAQAQPLRAGSVDDNEDFPAFLAYQDQFQASGLPVRDIDVSERHLIEVVDSNQRGIPNALITIRANDEAVAEVRTAADGTALVHPTAYDEIDPQDIVSVAVGQSGPIELIRQDPGIVTIVVTDDVAEVSSQQQGIDLDIVFVLDATGSMADEIERLQSTVDTVAASVEQLPGNPSVRLGLVHYRDEGDDYVTRFADLTVDTDEFRAALDDVRADGGGDYPEALDEALDVALNDMGWRDPATTTQIVFVVADAPPQAERDVAQPYDDSMRDAAARGIRVFPIASSGSSDDAEYVFRQLAQFTGARFVFLSYGAGGSQALGSETDIESADYDELPLDELIIRLVREEIEPLG